MRKSLLKTIVATAVVGATMALSSVMTYATTIEYKADSVSSDVASGSDIFTGVLKANSQTRVKSNGATISTVVVKSTTQVGNTVDVTKLQKNLALGGNTKTFTVTAEEGDVVGIYYAITGSNGYAASSNGTTTGILTVDGTAIDNDDTAVKNGKINYYETAVGTGKTTVAFSSTANRLNLVALTITSGATSDTFQWTVDTSALTGDFASIEADDFTITPAVDNSSAKIKYDADVFNTTELFYDEDEAILASNSSKVNASSAPISGTEFTAYTYAIKLSNDMFAVKPDVPVEDDSEKSFEASDVTASNDKEKFGAETTVGKFTFTANIVKRVTDSAVVSVQIPSGGTEKITFKANKGDVITIMFSANGGTDTTTAVLANSVTTVASNTTTGSGANGKQYLSIIAPKSDTYALTATGSSAAKVYSISVTPSTKLDLANCDDTVLNGKVIISGTTAYVIVAVSERDAAKASLKTVIGTKRLSFDTGYRQVKANGTTINAADLNANNGGAAELLYGFKITGLTSGAQEELIKHFAVEQ